jgi:phosphoenolpyruvate synthase/pyruvate phosphate dikinase
MSTQEERLETVEYNLRQFKTETIKVYQDMAFEMTMIKGLTEDTIKRLAKLSDTVEKRFERVDTRLDQVDIRLDRVDTRLDRVESMLAQILARLPEKP